TAIWLMPFQTSPCRDDGYDVADYYSVDPRYGTRGDVVECTHGARQRGIRVLIDLVINHTSNEHPWFKEARRDPASPYRDWYVWSKKKPPRANEGMVFPGVQKSTWSYDEVARAWYFHRFYDFQPDLNWSNPEVRAEVHKIMAFWLQLGASGFRIDAAPFVLEQVQADVDPGPKDFSILDDWRQDVQWRGGQAVLPCEQRADPEDLPTYCTAGPGEPNDRAHLLFAFNVNARLWLALARQEAEPLVEALTTLPRLPAMAQWATFLRNH